MNLPPDQKTKIDISVILPCRNEEAALGDCLQKIKQILHANNLSGEIIVSDSSKDSSPQIARQHDVVLVKHDKEGYGRAYLEGFNQAQGQYLFLADADGTYDFSEIPNFIHQLENGYDVVIGNRFLGNISQGSMPWINRYVGQPIFSFLFRLFFGYSVGDIHCGMRALRHNVLPKLNLHTTGMEFASEMMIKAVRQKLKIKELPIDYFPRKGESKLKPWADGWRHARFMLLYSPTFLFFIPGVLLMATGGILMILLYFNLIALGEIRFYYHPMFFASAGLILGYELIIFTLFAKTYAQTHLGEPADSLNFWHRHITIEKAGLIGLLLILIGGMIYSIIFWDWIKTGFKELQAVKISIIALTLVIMGGQTFFSAFMLSILGIKEK